MKITEKIQKKKHIFQCKSHGFPLLVVAFTSKVTLHRLHRGQFSVSCVLPVVTMDDRVKFPKGAR